jgi:hypothetical protein
VSCIVYTILYTTWGVCCNCYNLSDSTQGCMSTMNCKCLVQLENHVASPIIKPYIFHSELWTFTWHKYVYIFIMSFFYLPQILICSKQMIYIILAILFSITWALTIFLEPLTHVASMLWRGGCWFSTKIPIVPITAFPQACVAFHYKYEAFGFPQIFLQFQEQPLPQAWTHNLGKHFDLPFTLHLSPSLKIHNLISHKCVAILGDFIYNTIQYNKLGMFFYYAQALFDISTLNL